MGTDKSIDVHIVSKSSNGNSDGVIKVIGKSSLNSPNKPFTSAGDNLSHEDFPQCQICPFLFFLFRHGEEDSFYRACLSSREVEIPEILVIYPPVRAATVTNYVLVFILRFNP